MKRSLIALSLAALLPLAAQADDKLSYTYVEADYVNIDNDADGFGLRGSFEFGDSGFYGFGAYNWIETDVGSVDIDAGELGFGYAHGLGENLDLIGEAISPAPSAPSTSSPVPGASPARSSSATTPKPTSSASAPASDRCGRLQRR